MNITLINLPSGAVYSHFKRPTIHRLPIGLAYIAGYLEKAGHKVTVIDADALDMDFNGIIENCLKTRPAVVGTGATTPIVRDAMKVLKEIKSRDKHVYTVIGGPHISAMPRETLAENKQFLDFVVFGEGEKSCCEIVNHIGRGNRPAKPIEGAGFVAEDEKIIIGPPRPLEQNLDVFPFPARHLFPMDKYVDHTRFGTEPYTLIASSRGCTGRCIFCGSNTTWGHTVRFRSPQNVVDEIRECAERYGVTNVVFCDDTFTLKKGHAVEISKKICGLPYRINMFCASRINTVCPEMLEWLKKAGCYCITFGIESGNDRILKLMKKGITVDMIKYTVEITKTAGIQVHASFIIGNLGDTEETIEETIRLALSLDLDQAQFSILVPFPGTESYKIAEKKKRFRVSPDDFESFYWYYSVAANLTELPDERLIEIQKQAYKRWHDSKKSERIAL